MLKSGVSVAVSGVLGLGTSRERNWVLELGFWPYKSKHSRVWVSWMLSGDGRSDYLKVFGINLPTLRSLLDKLRRRVTNGNGETERG